jgi:hypothetical protein
VETDEHYLFMVGTAQKKREHTWMLMTDEDGNELWAKTLEQNFESGANSVIISNLHPNSAVFMERSGRYFAGNGSSSGG